jgi:hypothetical protein
MELKVIEGRQCGTCTACCTVMGVGEINKPRNTPCPHLAAGGGCGVYASKPESCTAFSCMWLNGNLVEDVMRPDQSGLVFSLNPTGFSGAEPVVHVHEVEPGKIDSDLGHAAITPWAQIAPVILLHYDGRRRLVAASPTAEWKLRKWSDKMLRIAKQAGKANHITSSV